MRKARCGPARGLDRLGDGPARGQGTLELIPAQCYQRMERLAPSFTTFPVCLTFRFDFDPAGWLDFPSM